MALVYLAELYALAIYFMGMFVNIWPMQSQPIPLPDDPTLLPTVDIFIPTYNESDDIVRITATAACQIDYPRDKLNIYILDDGASQAKRAHPESGKAAWERHYRLRDMARELGILYLTRETNQQAKAGNINHALEHCRGDLVLVLDCDHVPTRDILQRTVGHFIVDPKLFLVQTPHFFINPTPVERNLEGRANPYSEGDMFYKQIHLSLDFWNSSYFCGSAAILRRSCLQQVGGICGTTITEDAETAFRLHSLGYNSTYINRPMVCGLSPESYDDYVIQRSRWAQGMIQLLLLNNPLRTKGLSLPQKIIYLNSSFFWLFCFARLIYFAAPACYLILDLNVYHASWQQILAFTVPSVFSIYYVMDFLYADSRNILLSSIYESVQSLFLIPPVISAIMNPWKPAFKVTPKGMTNENNYLSPLAQPFFLVILINIIAIILSAMRWFSEPLMRDVIAVTVVWCFYNLYLSVASLGALWERRQIRRYHRIAASGPVEAYFPHMDKSYGGDVVDVSLTGIGLSLDLDFTPKDGDRATLKLQDSTRERFEFAVRLRHPRQRGKHISCGSEFLPELCAYPQIVRYVFGDSQRWQDIWEKKEESSGAILMVLHFLRTGLLGFIQGLLPITFNALKILFKLIRKWTMTRIAYDLLLTVSSWLIYNFYLGTAALLTLLKRKNVRKLRRLSGTGSARIYFPRLNATLNGVVDDISMTGMGVNAALPFSIEKDEQVTITVVSKFAKEFKFSCYIKRVISRGGKNLLGAEFIVDSTTYTQVVNYVYGSSLSMLKNLFFTAPSPPPPSKNTAPEQPPPSLNINAINH